MPKRLLGCIVIGIFLWDAEAPIVSIRDIWTLEFFMLENLSL